MLLRTLVILKKIRNKYGCNILEIGILPQTGCTSDSGLLEPCANNHRLILIVSCEKDDNSR